MSAQPSKRIRFNQGHFTDGAGTLDDDRDHVAPSRVQPRCTKDRPAPAFSKAKDYVHVDARVNPMYRNRMSVQLDCPHCGHSWREPR